MRRVLWPLFVIVTAVGLAAFVLLGVEMPLRVALTFLFFLLGPGMAFVPLLRLEDWLMELTLGVALSLALTTLFSEAMLYSSAWLPLEGTLGPIVLALVGAIMQLLWLWRGQHTHTAQDAKAP
jgi:hypothetical protein